MNCERVRELSSEVLDGALERDRTESFFAHLEACPPCRVFHEEIRVAIAMLGELPEVDVSDGFEDKVWSRIASESAVAARARHRALWPWVRARLEALSVGMGHRGGWSVAGVAAAVLVLALVSSDPAPRSSIAHSTTATGQEIASGASSVTHSVTRTPEARQVSEEDEFVAEMPVAVREYLKNAKELRLSGGAERYRRSNYSYPMRRVDDPSLFLMGEAAPRVGPSLPPPSQEEAAVISF